MRTNARGVSPVSLWNATSQVDEPDGTSTVHRAAHKEPAPSALASALPALLSLCGGLTLTPEAVSSQCSQPAFAHALEDASVVALHERMSNCGPPPCPRAPNENSWKAAAAAAAAAELCTAVLVAICSGCRASCHACIVVASSKERTCFQPFLLWRAWQRTIRTNSLPDRAFLGGLTVKHPRISGTASSSCAVTGVGVGDPVSCPAAVSPSICCARLQ